MRLRSSGPSPQWLLGIWCPLGLEVTLEPLCLCGHGTKCLCSLWKRCECFGKFCPRQSSMQLVLGRGSQWWQRRGAVLQRSRELSCSFHRGKDCTLWLSAAIHAGAIFVKLDTPWPVRCHHCSLPATALGTGMGGGDSAGPHRGKWIVAKLSIQQIKTSWRLCGVL